ncbi:GntR family transcriptional regulator [Alteribacillus sp. JSM 102045]|uniref:GntR family transcriptional regulator n=1 Tax=Alteribacillus sp. JSM 102045 TaxID=1562101 RepID=UPI0035C1BB2F
MQHSVFKEEKRTIEDEVADSLRRAILLGEFKRGDRIVQEEWAKKLGVSRMPIREALIRLELEGIVKNVPRKGAVVCPITPEDIEEIYTLRVVNESLAMEKALPFITDRDLEEIESILIEMENLDLTDKNIDFYSNLNKKYHQKMIERCPWRRVKQNVELLWTGFLPISSPRLLKNSHHKSRKEHRQIFEALSTKDEKVVKSIVEFHIERNKMDLIHSFKKRNL